MSSCCACGAQFSCGMVDGDGRLATEACWCTRLPALLPLPGNDADASCYCPQCLPKVLKQQQMQQ